jgi:hypothetical protein
MVPFFHTKVSCLFVTGRWEVRNKKELTALSDFDLSHICDKVLQS